MHEFRYILFFLAKFVIAYDDKWEDASQVDLGYLLFEKSEILNHSQAITFCEKRNSHLIEIETEEQMVFVVNKTKSLQNDVQVVSLFIVMDIQVRPTRL